MIKLLDAKHMAKLLRSTRKNQGDTKFFYGSLRELSDEIQVARYQPRSSHRQSKLLPLILTWDLSLLPSCTS